MISRTTLLAEDPPVVAVELAGDGYVNVSLTSGATQLLIYGESGQVRRILLGLVDTIVDVEQAHALADEAERQRDLLEERAQEIADDGARRGGSGVGF